MAYTRVKPHGCFAGAVETRCGTFDRLTNTVRESCPYKACIFPTNGFYRELPTRDALTGGQIPEPPVLFPLEVMVHPLDLRFKYHFSGDKPTNKLDKVRDQLLAFDETVTYF